MRGWGRDGGSNAGRVEFPRLERLPGFFPFAPEHAAGVVVGSRGLEMRLAQHAVILRVRRAEVGTVKSRVAVEWVLEASEDALVMVGAAEKRWGLE